jgi:hypothetical protein
MAVLLKPGFLQTAKSAADVQKLMKNDLKNSAGKGGLKFFAAKNYEVGGKKINLFIVTDVPNAYETLAKTQSPSALRAKGICDVDKDAGKVKVTIKTASGQMLADGIAKLIPAAMGNDAAIEAVPFTATGATPNAAKALEMAKKSHKEAREQTIDPKTGKPVAPKLDWPEFEPTAANVAALAQASLETADYKKFAAQYEKLAVKYKFNTDPDYKKVPVNIWHALIKNLAESGYITKHIRKVNGDPYKLIFADKGPGGQMIRDELLKGAMEGMSVYISHAAANLDKVAQAVLSNGGSTWAFWSGEGAKDAALKEAAGGVVLEGSIGSWYEKVWKFESLTGVNDMLLWNSMSELYARKAAEYYEKFKFVGFIGPGGSADTTVFVNIERPTLIQVLNVQKQVPVPPIEWYVVDCAPEPSSRSGWKGTGNPSTKVSSRVAAIEEVKKRYGR